MPYNPTRHHRRSIRLQEYDHTQAGAYFVTFCTWNRDCLFGEVMDGEMVLSLWGEIAQREWLATPQIRREAAFAPRRVAVKSSLPLGVFA